MLLSYRARAVASSTFGSFAADRVTDENPRNYRAGGRNAPSETLTFDLYRLPAAKIARRPPLAISSADRRYRPNAYAELPRPVRARYLRYIHGHVGAAHLAISSSPIASTPAILR